MLKGLPTITDARSQGLDTVARIKLYNSNDKFVYRWSFYIVGYKDYNDREVLFGLVSNCTNPNPLVIGFVDFSELERLEKDYKFVIKAKRDFKPKPLRDILNDYLHSPVAYLGTYKHVLSR